MDTEVTPSADRLSFASLWLAPYGFATALGGATGFILEEGGVPFLMTNFHVLSGRHPVTGAQLGAAVPDRLLIAMPRRGVPNGVQFSWRPVVQRLLDDDGRPLWAEHPRLGPAFDVVALPLSLPSDATYVSYSADPGPDLAVLPASEVVVIGFPEGVSGPGITPIWKAGTVASEISLRDPEHADFFWIDSNTRRGMSGAPVVARRFGTSLAATGGVSVHGGVADRVLGVYAGRAYDALDMTLGRVWRWEPVVEVAAHALELVRRGALAPHPCRLERVLENMMVTVDVSPIEIELPSPQGVIRKRIRATDLLRDALSDIRFGQSLGRVRLSAQLDAACRAADEGQALTLTEEQAALLAEALEEPQGWTYLPMAARQMLPMIDAILEQLRPA